MQALQKLETTVFTIFMVNHTRNPSCARVFLLKFFNWKTSLSGTPRT